MQLHIVYLINIPFLPRNAIFKLISHLFFANIINTTTVTRSTRNINTTTTNVVLPIQFLSGHTKQYNL